MPHTLLSFPNTTAGVFTVPSVISRRPAANSESENATILPSFHFVSPVAVRDASASPVAHHWLGSSGRVPAYMPPVTRTSAGLPSPLPRPTVRRRALNVPPSNARRCSASP